MQIELGHIFLVLVVLLVVISLLMGIQKVPEARTRIIERFGRYHRVLQPGLNFIIPFLDNVKSNIHITTFAETVTTQGFDVDGEPIEVKKSEPIDIVDSKTTFFGGGGKPVPYGSDIHMSEQLMDPLSSQMIAKDNAIIFPDVVLFFKIMEPHKAVYSVDNVGVALNKLLETTLRQETGKLDSDEIVSSRDILSSKIKSALEEASIGWGVRVTRVEIQEISFDKAVQDALSKARTEELTRRAEVVAAQQTRDKAILIAEGEKKSAILIAEGKKEAAILDAQGEFEAKKLEAEGNFLMSQAEAKGFTVINEALSNRADAVIALEALKAQIEVSKNLSQSKGMTMVLPQETAGLVGAIGSLQSGLNLMKSVNSNNPNSV